MKLLDIMTGAWAIIPEKLTGISRAYVRQLKSKNLTPESFLFKMPEVDEAEKPHEVKNGTAIINIEGVISKKLSWFSLFFGGCSTFETAKKLKAAHADPEAKNILLFIDSPGGSVDGTAELAELIYSLRGDKPIIAFTDGMMCSAAYWIASAADKRYISSDTTIVGSIDVIATHIDYSKAYEEAGIKVTEIISGKYKNVGSPYNPLSKDHKEVIQDEIDYIKTVFVNDVAKHLGIGVDQVIETMTTDTRPPVFIGKQAITAGLVDGVTTFDDLINDIAVSGSAGMFSASTNKDDPNNILKEGISMTLEELKAKHSDLYGQIVQESMAAGIEKGKTEAQAGIDTKLAEAKKEGEAEGITKGAADELTRVKDVMSMSVSGCEALIQECIEDGVTTGSQAAVKVLAKKKADHNTDGEGVAVDVTLAPEAEGTGVDPNAPLKDQAKTVWDSKPEIRTEFLDNFDAYLSYLEKSKTGQARILKRD